MDKLVFKFDQTYISSKVSATINDNAACGIESVAGEIDCMTGGIKNFSSERFKDTINKNPAYWRAGELEVSEFGFPFYFL